MRLTELGALLDAVDEAVCEDSKYEIEALRLALACAVGALIEQGNEIPRGDELDADDEDEVAAR